MCRVITSIVPAVHVGAAPLQVPLDRHVLHKAPLSLKGLWQMYRTVEATSPSSYSRKRSPWAGFSGTVQPVWTCSVRKIKQWQNYMTNRAMVMWEHLGFSAKSRLTALTAWARVARLASTAESLRCIVRTRAAVHTGTRSASWKHNTDRLCS